MCVCVVETRMDSHEGQIGGEWVLCGVLGNVSWLKKQEIICLRNIDSNYFLYTLSGWIRIIKLVLMTITRNFFKV